VANSVRFAERRDAERIFRFLVPMHEEIATAPLDPGEAYLCIVNTIENEVAIIVEDEDGEIVGSVGLTCGRYWYNPAHQFLSDLWAYVTPDQRGGAAWQLLLEEVARFSDEVGMDCLLIINNPKRRRTPRTSLQITATALRFQPHGVVMANLIRAPDVQR
jgi:hypothetical protein